VGFIDNIETFVRIVDAGSLSQAARQRAMSVPTVSRQLAELEADLGAALIVRTTRRLHLTPAGEALHTRALALLRAVEDTRAVSRVAALEGPLVVSAPITLGQERIVPAMPSSLAAHPGVFVDLRLEDRFVDIVGEGIDVAIRGAATPPDGGGYIARRIARWRRIVVAAPALIARLGAPRTPDALQRLPALLHRTSTGVRRQWRLERAQGKATGHATVVAVSGPLATNSLLSLRDAATAGLGVALLPEWLVAPAVATGALVHLLPGWTGELAHVSAFYRREQRGTDRIKAFIAHLEQAFASLTPPAT